MVIRYGDSIRAYGLGIALMLLVLGAMWRLVESFTPGRALFAAVSAVLSVQCLYYDSILLLAICLGAAAVTMRRRQIKETLIVFGIGGISAATLLPYVPTIQRVHLWNFIWKAPFTPGELWRTFGSRLEIAIWFILFALALVAGAWAMWRRKSADAEDHAKTERILFALVTLVIGTAGYAGFICVLGYLTQPWYYIAFAAFAATCIDIVLASIWTRERSLLARAFVTLAIVGISAYPAWRALHFRQTNVDVVAAQLEAQAAPDDLILINSWNYGISFRHYYHGPAKYETIPPIEDLRSHRVDLLKAQMMAHAPMAPVLQRMDEILRSGHTIWLIGSLSFAPLGKDPKVISPGYDGPNGWVGGDFYSAWALQAGFLVQRHARQVERVRVPLAQPVAHYENLPLSAIRGWRGAADTQAQ
jgi:hypothetical protein